MIALARFQLASFCRSTRAILPLLGLLILLFIVFRGAPDLAAGTPDEISVSILSAYAASAAALFPLQAWAARNLLDTEPDLQRTLSAFAVGGGARSLVVGLLSAYTVSVTLAVITIGWSLLQFTHKSEALGLLPVAIVLYLLGAIPATLVGALTTRAILPTPAMSFLMLASGCTVLLLVSFSPAAVLFVSMGNWMRAANSGTLIRELPIIAVRIAVWSALGVGVYAWLRRTRL